MYVVGKNYSPEFPSLAAWTAEKCFTDWTLEPQNSIYIYIYIPILLITRKEEHMISILKPSPNKLGKNNKKGTSRKKRNPNPQIFFVKIGFKISRNQEKRGERKEKKGKCYCE